MIDPRASIIEERLKGIKRIIAVSSAKGGVGKSMVASTLAVALSKKGKVGLLDLDFYGPSSHLILGAGELYPKEDYGIVPPEVAGVKLMSLIYFTKDRPLAMRGSNISDAILEIMAITRWGELDYLVIDMPPGIGEETLDVIRLIKRCEFIVVTTQSKVAWEVVKRLLSLFKEMKVKVIGIVENMRLTEAHSVEEHLGEFGYKYLSGLPFDTALEEAVGNPEKILKTNYGKALKKIAEKL